MADLPADNSSAAPPERIAVSPAELERAIAVWLKVMPAALWRPYLAMLAIDPKRRNEDDRVDPGAAIAAWIAGKFVQARWEASYPEPPQQGSPPAWRGE